MNFIEDKSENGFIIIGRKIGLILPNLDELKNSNIFLI